MFFRLCLHPNRVTVGEQVVESLLFGYYASSNREHRALALGQHPRQGSPLYRAIAGLPIEGKYFTEGHSRVLLDLAIELDERDAHLQGEFRSQRRLASSAQPNQRDALAALLFSWAEVAHQPEHHIFQTVIGKTLEKSLDHLFFSRLFHFWGEQLRERNVESGGNPPKQHDGDVSFPSLELSQVTFGDIRFPSYDFAGHAAEVA